MSRPKVFFTGGDDIGWALDEDLRNTKSAVEDIIQISTLQDCDVIHSVWWSGLASIPNEALYGKRIICHVSAEPYRYTMLTDHRHIVPKVGQWVVQSTQAATQLRMIGLQNHMLIPYVTDPIHFYPIKEGSLSLSDLKSKWNIPEKKYLIGNFHRDSEGANLHTPKVVKGPDIFLEIVSTLWNKGYPIHVVLTGPRRHWMRKQLAQLGIPYTFIGEITLADDININIQPRSLLNHLYNLINLYLVTSRSEGGPHSIMEAAAAQCGILSTPVGLAGDILEQKCIYFDPTQAIELIERDIQNNWISETLDPQYTRVSTNHTPDAVRPLFKQLYDSLEHVAEYTKSIRQSETTPEKPLWYRALQRAIPKRFKPELSVGLWHTFFQPPYGGGNQFMLALKKGLLERGISIYDNRLSTVIDAYLLNSIHFEVDAFLEFSKRNPLNVVHRIDGPIHLIRGFDREKDELCFELNQRFAKATILQSTWTYQRIIEMGYQPVKPVIIHNAVDPDIFHPQGRIEFDPTRKIRLISTSWSANPRKGGPIYKWLEENLDWDCFEYTFVGNVSEEFRHIRKLPPLPSDQLADILRQHDIYITASQNDPCSNALIEALSCGLPALYLNDGGHPELVGYGGLSFNNQEEALSQLEVLVKNYKIFQRLITVPTIKSVVDSYLIVLNDVAR
jgi:glycosyltransferase involved in cell wall biosynthesis